MYSLIYDFLLLSIGKNEDVNLILKMKKENPSICRRLNERLLTETAIT